MKADVFKNRQRWEEIIHCLLFFGIGVALLIYSLYHHTNAKIEWMVSPYLFPLLISIFLIFLAVGLYVETQCRLNIKNLNSARKEAKIEDTPQKTEWKKLAVSALMLYLYYQLMPIIGFLVSGSLFLAGMFWFFEERRLWLITLLSVGTVAILYGLFYKLLHVMLP